MLNIFNIFLTKVFFMYTLFFNTMSDTKLVDGIRENPEELGFSATGLANVVNLLKNQVTKGLHSGVQLSAAFSIRPNRNGNHTGYVRTYCGKQFLVYISG